jgi:hypothetical protein
MIQEIITYIILVATVIITIVKTIRFFNETNSACAGCAGFENGCKIAGLKKFAKQKN